ncbi:MAG TPA: hypothetical protein VN618_07985 [Solirubrobacteraceae bacterium]|nr:hypothetical protein [Solirubrobacteraceae bacterium]
MLRRVILAAAVAALASGAAAGTAAAETVRLYMSEGSAFATLGHSCGGIQQDDYVTGFSVRGYPTGNVYLQTRCGGSGRGGGYHVTTYTATASVEWSWFGETRSYGPMSGSLEATPAEDAYGDRLFNTGAAAYLETGTPPLQAPAAPTGVGASVGLYESGSLEYLRMGVSWTEAPETEGLIEYSTVVATPVGGSKAPVLSATTSSNYFREAFLSPVEPNTTYSVTVTNTDREGTSAQSAPIEVRSPNSDGEAERERLSYVVCAGSTGTIKLSPGLSETPKAQTITVKGALSECEGPGAPERGMFTVKERTSEEVTCSYLQSTSLEATTTAGSLSVKWLPAEEGGSKGALTVPVSEVSMVGISGSLAGGPFAEATPVKSASIAESFPQCGVPEGKKGKIKPVKSGAFSTGEVQFH